MTKEEWLARELEKAPDLTADDIEWVRRRFRLEGPGDAPVQQ
ncbi:hypothetical protein [Streptomyces sp. CBMA123]|nr:hypothetical protein [Streptomyces sp. CBMA123]